MNNFSPQVQNKGRAFSTAALVLGFISISTTMMMTVWFPYIFGALAVLFAILSCGEQLHMDAKARIGARTAVLAMIINTILIIAVVYAFYTDENLRNAFYQSFENVYGMSFEDFMNALREGNVQ